MEYDFDIQIDRRGTNSLKWEVGENELPLWVADMDFKTAPEIIEAIKQRAEHGVFGYSILPEEWYASIIHWWNRRHSFEIQRDWLAFCTGVVPAVSSIIRKLTNIGENVLIQTPVYNIFFNSIRNNGRNVLESPLKYKKGSYSVDFEDLERRLSDPQTTMMLLCNPHNPIGKIWDKETLGRIGELCLKHHVIVVSDEIHCDLTEPGCDYIPFASVSEVCRDNSVTCLSPTKAFNLAGLHTAAVMVPNEALRHKVVRALNTDEIAEPNVFAVQAAVAAFTKGKAWLFALRDCISKNRKYVQNFLDDELPQLELVPSQATYLLWIDCGSLLGDAGEFARMLRENTGLYLSAGAKYGGNGDRFLRMNIACPKKTLEDAMERLKGFVPVYEEWVITQC